MLVCTCSKSSGDFTLTHANFKNISAHMWMNEARVLDLIPYIWLLFHLFLLHFFLVLINEKSYIMKQNMICNWCSSTYPNTTQYNNSQMPSFSKSISKTVLEEPRSNLAPVPQVHLNSWAKNWPTLMHYLIILTIRVEFAAMRVISLSNTCYQTVESYV